MYLFLLIQQIANIFYSYTSFYNSMVLTEIICPICNTVNPTTIVTRENRGGLSAKIASFEHSKSYELPSYVVTCSMCGNTYQYFEMRNHSWLRSRLLLSAYSIETFKIIAETCGNPIECDETGMLDWIFGHIVGVTRPKPGYINIFFDLMEHRIFLSCFEERKFLSGLSVYKVY